MENKLSLRIGNFLYHYAYPLYKPVYFSFKRKQDAPEINLIKKFVKPGFNVLDIGANIGFYARILSDQVGSTGSVVCFEADRQNFKHLQTNLNGYNNVMIHNVAVADAAGELDMYVSHRLNVDNRTYKPEQYKTSYKVKAQPVDEVIKPGSRIDFVKMDIQGAEFLALKGMQRVMKENSGMVILTEIAPHFLLLCSNTTVDEFAELLKSNGFILYLVKGDSLVPFNKSLFAGDNQKDYYENLLAVKGEEYKLLAEAS